MPRCETLLALLFLCVLAGGGCSTPESRYYLPEPIYDPAGDASGPIIFVDEATVAPYADRTQFVTRVDPVRVRFEEFDVWAEPVANVITRYLVDALGNRYGRANVLATPPGRPFDPQWRVLLDVLRIDASDDGAVVLDARWTLFRGPYEDFVGTGRERFIERLPPADDDTADDQNARVEAIGRMLEALAARIASEISS
jgi:uncharacterized lipoprotein YmbA